ncbi:MAG: acyl carrier protein [Butyrivibrio sp.]|nr:acyl carrier protein [Butyrivibrio sp.]
MTNLEKYIAAFTEGLGVDESVVNSTLEYQSIDAWDSVGHMGLIAELENVFEIEMDTDDIVDFSSFDVGKDILKRYGIEI